MIIHFLSHIKHVDIGYFYLRKGQSSGSKRIEADPWQLCNASHTLTDSCNL